MVGVEDSDLLRYLDFNDVNALTTTCRILYANRKTTRIRWIKSFLKNQISEIYDRRTITTYLQLSPPALEFSINLLNNAFDKDTFWPFEVLLSILPKLEPSLVYSCIRYCFDKINAIENESKVWSPNQLRICDILLTLKTTNFLQRRLGGAIINCESHLKRHLLQDRYDLVQLFWPHVYSKKAIQDGIIYYDLVEYLADYSRATTTRKIEFLLQGGVKTCQISYSKSAPFLESMLSAVLHSNRYDNVVHIVEKLMAWGVDPMNIALSLTKNDKYNKVDQITSAIDVFLNGGVSFSSKLNNSTLGRSLIKQYKRRITWVVDYLVELGELDGFEVVKAVLGNPSQIRGQGEWTVESAFFSAVKKGHDHLLNLLSTKANNDHLNIMGGRYLILAAQANQPASLHWLFEAGGRPTLDQTNQILNNVLSQKYYTRRQISETRVCKTLLDLDITTPIQLFNILAKAISTYTVRVINWDSVSSVLKWMSKQEFFTDTFLECVPKPAVIILTTALEKRQFLIADFCLNLGFGKGQKPPAIGDSDEGLYHKNATVENMLTSSLEFLSESSLVIIWILDTPGFKPSSTTLRKLLLRVLLFPTVNVIDKLLDLGYVSQFNLLADLPTMTHEDFFGRSHLVGLLRILSRRGLLQPPPKAFIEKYYRETLLLQLANTDNADLLVWLIDSGEKPNFSLNKLVDICLCRHHFNVIEKLLDLKFIDFDFVIKRFCHILSFASTSTLIMAYNLDRDYQPDESVQVVLWLLKAGYLDDTVDTISKQPCAYVLLENALYRDRELIINTLMACGVGFGDEGRLLQFGKRMAEVMGDDIRMMKWIEGCVGGVNSLCA
ncbi:hypothetical protein HDU76_002206 [Blyttiomyces sp. JEL0837]|nr:hypothetical protein HDU76_002206 [Blyttiomyces sp. JEL0837]